MRDARVVARGIVPHQGVDLMLERGHLVVSATEGVVVASRWDGTGVGGWLVIIDATGISSHHTYRFLYAHLMLPAFVKGGDRVATGQLLGLSGATGGSVGARVGATFSSAHLHFSCATGGRYIDVTAQLAREVRSVRPGVYALPQDSSGIATQQAMSQVATAANSAPGWYVHKLVA